MKNNQHTCQAKWLKAKLCAIQDDKAVSLVQPCCRVLHIALKVPGLLSRTDLLDLPNVNWETDTQNTLSKTTPSFTTEIKIRHLNHRHVTISWSNSQATLNHEGRPWPRWWMVHFKLMCAVVIRVSLIEKMFKLPTPLYHNWHNKTNICRTESTKPRTV